MKNYTYYLYFEHRCSSGRPRTDEMCVFYHKEGGECLHSMIYSSLDVDMDQFYETKQWHKDEEEIKGYIDGPHTETNRWMCHVQFILFKGIPLFSVPLTEPQNFTVSGESSNSVNLSWEAIPIRELRGFLSHYRFCSLKINSEQKDKGTMFRFHHDYVAKRSILWSRREETHITSFCNWCIYNWKHILHGCAAISMFLVCLVFFPPVCYNVSASVTEHRLVNLTPGSKYNISLAAVTGAGEGPQVIRIINTLPENRTGNNLKRVRPLSVSTQDLNTTFSSTPNIPFFPSTQCCCGSWVCCLWCF